MKNKRWSHILLAGGACVLLTVLASWYSIACNDARWVVPMDFSQYTFRVRDLPMIAAIALLTLYVLYLFSLLLASVLKGRRSSVRVTRSISPWLGLCGFLGLLGFLGFWTYSVDKTVFPFAFFLFFGFFGFFYEGRMSNTLRDERFRENQMRARMTAGRVSRSIIFLATLVLAQGRLFDSLEHTLIALIIVISLAIALDLFLGEYLLYHYDQDMEPGQDDA